MTLPSTPANGKNPIKDRSPVQRRHAPTYVLIILLSFAFSVTATRIFLNLTGFPSIGTGELHIAHVLWGGLFLFIASLIPLILVNQWALELSSFFAGIGVGLFIDEVGKFITRNNNYFFPSAAPIIYAFFLLTVLVFIQVNHQRKQAPRTEMYAILEDFAEVLDRDLSQFEFDRLFSQLESIIIHSSDAQLIVLAKSLRTFLIHQKSQIVPHDPGPLEKIQAAWNRFELKFLNQQKMRFLLVTGLFMWGIWALTSQTIVYLATHPAQRLTAFIQQFIIYHPMPNASGMNWFEAQILLEGSMGIISLIAVGLFLFKKEKLAVWVGTIDLIVTLIVVNLITFYFDQFSTIAFVAFQFVLLIFLLMYRRRFLSPQAKKIQEIKSSPK